MSTPRTQIRAFVRWRSLSLLLLISATLSVSWSAAEGAEEPVAKEPVATIEIGPQEALLANVGMDVEDLQQA